MDSESDSESEISISTVDKSVTRSVTGRKVHGLLKSYHGIVYQVQWIMVIALQSIKSTSRSRFQFRTEVEEQDAGKFDDVVWEYHDGSDKKYNFLQCKHKLDSNAKITLNELLKKNGKNKSSPFSLQKYFISYRDQIKDNNCHKVNCYKDGIIENLIIATNIPIGDDLKAIFELVHIRNPVLKAIKSNKNLQRESPQYWKINSNNVPSKLINGLEETYDLIQLAKKLGEQMKAQKQFTLPDHLKCYTKSLYDNTVDQTNHCLSDNFINGRNLSKQAEYLREAFLQEEFVKKRTAFDFLSNDYHIASPKEIAQVLANLISISKFKIVKITKHSKIIRENINSLSGYILIEEDGIKFNPSFWLDSENDFPSLSIKIFRSALINNLQLQNVINQKDSEIIIAEKLDEYRFDINNFKTCRKELINEISFWDKAKCYNKFHDKSLNNGVYKDLPNYDLNYIKKEINIFFDLLILAVNFSKSFLCSIVENELKNNFTFINTEYMAYAFRTEICKSLDVSEDGYMSNTVGVLEFINKAKQIVSNFILIGPTLEYRLKSKTLQVEFSRQSIKKLKLCPFVSYSKEQILIVIATHVKLSSVKVLQALNQIPEYQIDGSYIFMQIDTILCLQDLVTQVFSSNCNLLIIEYDVKDKTCLFDFNIEELFESLSGILTLNCNKKVVIIMSYNKLESLQKLKACLKTDSKTISDKINNIMNLTKQSRCQILRTAQIYFQGEKVNLETIIVREVIHLIKAEVLFKLISNDDLVIGTPVDDLGTIKDYYIPRSVCQNVAIKMDVLKENDVFLISNVSELALNLELLKLGRRHTIDKSICLYDYIDTNKTLDSKSIILLDSENSKAAQQFSRLSCTYSNHTMHWMEYKRECFFWQKSQGSLSNIRNHLCKNKIGYEKNEIDFLSEIENKRIIVLSAEPGMGKSTIATKIALSLKTKTTKWIIRVNLLHYATDFKKFIDETFLIHFLYKAAKLQFLGNKCSINESKENMLLNISLCDGKLIANRKIKFTSLEFLEIEIFNYLFNHGKVIILVDGYDEICPTYKNKVLKLLKYLKRTMIANIVITTRPYNILYYLEDLASNFSFTLKPFDVQDQTEFLLKYWKSNLKLTKIDIQRANIFISELLLEFSKTTNDLERDFVSIPLQLRMLADNFKTMFYEFCDSTTKHTLNNLYKTKIKTKLNLLVLYEDFLKTKFTEIRFKEKKTEFNCDDADLEQVMKREYNTFIKDHQRLAVYALFHDECAMRILTKEEILKVKKCLVVIKKANDKNGIIFDAINDIPIFIHQTFVEYFAASYLWQKFKVIDFPTFDASFLQGIIIESLFSGKHIQSCIFFCLMAREDLKRKTKFPFKNEKIFSLLRSLVHIITLIYDAYENVGGYLTNGSDYLSDDNFGVNMKFESGYVPCIKLLFQIIEQHINCDESNKEIIEIISRDHTIHILRMAAEVGCVNISKLFLNIKQYNYKQDLCRKKWYMTPLWLAARNKHLEVVNILKKIYNPLWVDKDCLSLQERVFNNNDHNVLESCLKLRILDGSPFKSRSVGLQLPLVHALRYNYPDNIIKMLLVITNVHILNEFQAPKELRAPYEIICSFLRYEDVNLQLATSMGVCFNGVLNLLFHEFSWSSLHDHILTLRFAFFGKCCFYTDAEFLIFPKIVEMLLKSGVGYNTKCIKFKKYTLRYIEGFYHIQAVINEILNSRKPLHILAKVCIDILRYGSHKIILRNNQICLIYGRECVDFLPEKLKKLFQEMKRSPNRNIYSILHNLRVYIEDANEEIKRFKTYRDNRTYNNIFIGYEEMLKYVDFENKDRKMYLFNSLGNLEKYLFGRILELYIRQNYNIVDAYKEIGAEVHEAAAIKHRLYFNREENSSITIEELLQIFGLNTLEMTPKLQELTADIYKSDSIKLLHQTWSSLTDIGQNRLTETLKSMTKCANISSELYQLFRSFDDTYKILISAILSENYELINDILESIEPCYVKAVVNAQNDECGSPLHHAVHTENIKLTKLLLLHGANPNFKLDTEVSPMIFPFRDLRYSDDEFELDSSNDDYPIIHDINEGLSSLHIAVNKGNLEIIQLLIKYGADYKVKTNWEEASLNIAIKKLPKTTNASIYHKISNSSISDSNTSRFQIHNKQPQEDKISMEVHSFPSSSGNIRKRKAHLFSE